MKKIKIILILIITIIITSSITAYATYNYLASEISYTKNKEKISVEQALNELYEIKNRSAQIIYDKTYVGDGITLTYNLDKDYKQIIIQADCRAADTMLYVNVSSTDIELNKIYDSGETIVMDKSYDRTVVYEGIDTKEGDIVTIQARWKGTIVIYGIN